MNETVITILAITLLFGSPLLIVAVVLYASYRKRRLLHETITQYVAKDRDIPPEVLEGLHKETKPANNLQKGMIYLALGLGTGLALYLMGETNAAALGFIPLFIGIAYLFIWKLDTKPA